MKNVHASIEELWTADLRAAELRSSKRKSYFETVIDDVVNLSRRLRDACYADDHEGQNERTEDLLSLTDKLSMLRNYYQDHKGNL